MCRWTDVSYKLYLYWHWYYSGVALLRQHHLTIIPIPIWIKSVTCIHPLADLLMFALNSYNSQTRTGSVKDLPLLSLPPDCTKLIQTFLQNWAHSFQPITSASTWKQTQSSWRWRQFVPPSIRTNLSYMLWNPKKAIIIIIVIVIVKGLQIWNSKWWL
jgi:hypothetical protein